MEPSPYECTKSHVISCEAFQKRIKTLRIRHLSINALIQSKFAKKAQMMGSFLFYGS